MGAIVVVGSANLDVVARTARFPSPGETVVGESVGYFAGGKGANQAAAAAKLGGDASFVGRVGDDAAGDRLLRDLAAVGVDTRCVIRTLGTTTGTAIVTVDEAGENRIVMVPGANALVSADDLDCIEWPAVRALLLQLEIPRDVVVAAARRAHEHGALVLLDPAPVVTLPDALWSLIDVLLPNQQEAEVLSGIAIGGVPSARSAASRLAARGSCASIVKLGADGAVIAEGNYISHIPSVAVNVVDTTAAGDAFAGALAVALVAGEPLASAAVFACRAGALAVTRPGAQSSLPTRQEVDQLSSMEPAAHPVG
jgi:ribokinase